MDTIDTINCPACGKKMEKVFIPSEGINIDICTEGCGGIFFDNREFNKFNEQHEDITEIENKIKGKVFKQVDDTTPRMCPVCGNKMVKNTSAVEAKIIVDDCYICGGKFLDHEELFKIRNEFENDSARKEAAMEYLYSKIGSKLNEIDEENIKRKASRNLAQKLFYSILKM